MFIKLSFTANTRITVPLRMLMDIINTNTITSVSALQSRFTSGSYSSTLTANFDAANSTIIRTVDPSNTKAHYTSYANTRPDYGISEFTIEQPTYDAPGSKIYTQLSAGSVSTNLPPYFAVGTAITGGTINSSSLPLTVSDTSTSTSGVTGTTLTLGGNPLAFSNQIFSAGNGYDNIRTFWAYVTDTCFFFATTNGTSYNSGFGPTYADPTKFCGPYFQTQYTRYDYHNTDSNGICPVLYTSPRGVGLGYGTSADLTTVQNIKYTSNSTTLPLRVHGMVNALPQVGSSWPIIYNNYVHMTMAGRTSAIYGLNQAQVLGTVGSSTTPSVAGGVSTAASTRYPSANLSSTGFGLMPFGWEANAFGNHGGNASDQNGVYIFNGDYVPGDTFTYNNKVYMVWPMYSGYSNRLGFAVPME